MKRVQLLQYRNLENAPQRQISRNLVRPFQLLNRCQIWHGAQQFHCGAICKFQNDKETKRIIHEQTTFLEIGVDRVSIGSDNGLSPVRRQAIIWTNAVLFSIVPSGTKFSEIRIKIQDFSFMKMHLKISSAKRRPFCPGKDELRWVSEWCPILQEPSVIRGHVYSVWELFVGILCAACVNSDKTYQARPAYWTHNPIW